MSSGTKNDNINSLIASYIGIDDVGAFCIENNVSYCNYVLNDVIRMIDFDSLYIKLPIKVYYLLQKCPVIRMRKICVNIDFDSYYNYNFIAEHDDKIYFDVYRIAVGCVVGMDFYFMRKFVNLRELKIALRKSMTININGCVKLRKLVVKSYEVMRHDIEISDCRVFRHLDVVGMENCIIVDKPEKIAVIKLENCRDMSRGDFLRRFENVVILDIGYVDRVDLGFLGSSCKSLVLSNCGYIDGLNGLRGCDNLRSFSVKECESLHDLNFLSNNLNLEILNVVGLMDYGAIGLMSRLRKLKVDHISLDKWNCRVIGKCVKLEELNVHNVIIEDDAFNDLVNLRNVSVVKSEFRRGMYFLRKCVKLESIVIHDCSLFTNGKMMDDFVCYGVGDVEIGGYLGSSLKSLVIVGCYDVWGIDLSGCVGLRSVFIRRCENMRYVRVDGCVRLESLVIIDCHMLSEVYGRGCLGLNVIIECCLQLIEMDVDVDTSRIKIYGRNSEEMDLNWILGRSYVSRKWEVIRSRIKYDSGNAILNMIKICCHGYSAICFLNYNLIDRRVLMVLFAIYLFGYGEVVRDDLIRLSQIRKIRNIFRFTNVVSAVGILLYAWVGIRVVL